MAQQEPEDTFLLHDRSQEIEAIKRSFSPSQQTLRWFLVVVSVTFHLASFKIYEDKDNLDSTQVRSFNVITTVLALVLGLCFFDAFKDVAKGWRWKVLAKGGWNDAEKRRILEIAKWTAVAELGWKSREKRAIPWVCILWIVLNIGAQTSVAVINLTYSLQDGVDWNGTYVRPSQVNSSNLTYFYHFAYDEKLYRREGPELTHSIVHAYGESAYGSLTQAKDCAPYSDVADVLHSRKNPVYFCRRAPPGQQEFTHRFLEYNPRDQQQTYPFLTNRSIAVSAGQCNVYSITSVERGSDTNSQWTNYTLNDTSVGDLSIPARIDNFDGTVYIYRDFDIPQNASRWSCGPRCIRMWAHKTVYQSEPTTVYQCPITVSPVRNASLYEHGIPDGVARLAASAIGLEGGKSNSDQGWTQFQFYPYASAWDIHHKPADEVGANMAEFALGSLATMAANNPSLPLPGNLPTLGSRVKVDWTFALILLLCIAGCHLVLFALAIYAQWWNKTNLLQGRRPLETFVL